MMRVTYEEYQCPLTRGTIRLKLFRREDRRGSVIDDLDELLRRLMDGEFYQDHDGDARLVGVLRTYVAALAAGSRREKTPQAVECEASQSGGGSRNAPKDKP